VIVRSRFSLTITFVALAQLAADWPQHLGPNRDGHSAETKLVWGKPSIAWTKALGRGWSAPLVVDNRLYVFHRVDDELRFSTFDAATGVEHWTFKHPTRYSDDFGMSDGPRATPTIADGVVYLLGPDGELFAVDATTGASKWRKELRKEFVAGKGYFGLACSPLVVDGLVVVNIGGKGAGVVALDASTGAVRWKATNDEASYSSPIVADLGGQKRIVVFTRRGIVGVSLAGEVVFEQFWRSRIDASVNAATPLSLDGHIFATSSYGTGAILLKPGATKQPDEVWSNDKSLSSQYSTPIRVGDFLFGTDGRSDSGTGELRCIAWKTGDIAWKQPRFGCASVVGVDGRLLGLTESGTLVTFEPSSIAYRERDRLAILGAKTRANPAFANGRYYARDDDQLVCVVWK
jgi:outer membrane protein assembly factor BamB